MTVEIRRPAAPRVLVFTEAGRRAIRRWAVHLAKVDVPVADDVSAFLEQLVDEEAVSIGVDATPDQVHVVCTVRRAGTEKVE